MGGFSEWGEPYPNADDDCTGCEHPKFRHIFDDPTAHPGDGAWCSVLGCSCAEYEVRDS